MKIPLAALIEMVADGASACYRRRGPEACGLQSQITFYMRLGFHDQLAQMLAHEFMANVAILKEQDALKQHTKT